MNQDSLDKAVEITKAAVPMSSGSWIPEPDSVAKFIQVVAKAIEGLRKQ